MDIKATDLIRIRRNVKIEISEEGVLLEADAAQWRTSPLVLRVMASLYEWTTVADAYKTLAEGCKDSNAFESRMAEFGKLVRNRILESDPPRTFGFHHSRFDSFPVHVRMLNDSVRTQAYRRALKETITPDDVVLDIGAGSGVLTLFAVRCGAKHVYAVERTRFIDAARETVRRNGLDEGKVSFLHGDSREIELPERATVLVSEIIGNDPLEEGILATFMDAKARLLAPGARIIPRKMHIRACAIEMPPERYDRANISQRNLERWKNEYDIDFSGLRDFIDGDRLWKGNENSARIGQGRQLSESISLFDIDFEGAVPHVGSCERPFSISQEGCLNTVMIYVDAELSRDNVLSLHPSRVTPTNSWALQVHHLPVEKDVQKGDQFKLHVVMKDLRSELRIEPVGC